MAEDAIKLRDWILDNAGLEAQSMPIAIRVMWLMDRERWEAYEGEHTQNTLEEAAALDLSTEELASYDDLATVLECRFGRVEPAVGLRQRLGTRYRKPWENGGAGGQREVQLAAPTSLQLPLAQAERAEAVLEESECSQTTGEAQKKETKPTHLQPEAYQAQACKEPTWQTEIVSLTGLPCHRRTMCLSPTCSCVGAAVKQATSSANAPNARLPLCINQRHPREAPWYKWDTVGPSTHPCHCQPPTFSAYNWGPTIQPGE
ncbi:hypothetical protein EOD39_7703 [Acipenser ruthenus]|uniref:Uncharacterized protein n=1 Tax=Acipenser ruthenus TaxID=7906 RepID=A0A444U630_ACIRT|nr:hypothetical protein EOD39_7703 [Acipenser ruthenus]